MTLDEIQARADAATEGPWEATPNDRIVSSTRTWPEGDPYDVAGMFGHKGAVVEGCRTPDAEFIAHAREDVPRLVAALKAVEAVHIPAGYTESVLDWDCIEGECEHDDDCPEKTITPCRQCTLPSLDGAEILIPWPCPTIAAIKDALGS